MDRRIISSLFALTFVAGVAWAETQGFNATFEESSFTYPPFDVPLAADFKAPVGMFRINSNSNVEITTSDPTFGPLPCDPTSSKGLRIDATQFAAEVKYEFPLPAAGKRVVTDKMVVGASDVYDRFGLEFGVYSAVTQRFEPVFQFGPNAEVLVYGLPVVDPMTSMNLIYQSVWANDCAAGIDNHFTVVTFHDLTSGTVRVDLETHGLTAQTIALGPFAMNPQTTAEGIGGMYTSTPGGTGEYFIDNMVCVGQAPVIQPTSTGGRRGGSRTRY